MSEQSRSDRFHGPTQFIAAESSNVIEACAEKWKPELDKSCLVLFERLKPEDRDTIMDTLYSQGLGTVRDVLLLDYPLTEAIPEFAFIDNRQAIARKLSYMPWRLNEKPSIVRDEQLCTNLNEIPLQALTLRLFDERRHLLTGSRRVTIADALLRNDNFEALLSRTQIGGSISAEADRVHALALEYARDFHHAKGWDIRTGDNPWRIPPQVEEAQVPPPSPAAIDEHIEKFGL